MVGTCTEPNVSLNEKYSELVPDQMDLYCRKECLMKKFRRIDENGTFISYDMGHASKIYPLAKIGQILSEAFLKCSDDVQKISRSMFSFKSQCSPTALKFVTCISLYSFSSCPVSEQDNSVSCLNLRDLIVRMNYGMKIF